MLSFAPGIAQRLRGETLAEPEQVDAGKLMMV
jgi:hypothetical protein